jgi:hypothetical protein
LHDTHHLRPLDAQQMLEFGPDARVPAWRDVVACALWQPQGGISPFVLLAVVFRLSGECLVHCLSVAGGTAESVSREESPNPRTDPRALAEKRNGAGPETCAAMRTALPINSRY